MAIDTSRVLFLAENLADAGTVTCTDEVALMPASRLLNPRLGKRTRTQTVLAANTKFVQDMGETVSADVVWLGRHNFTTSATWRLIFSPNSDLSSPVLDTGAISAGAVANWRRNSALYLATSPLSFRYLGLYLDDHTNPAAYLEMRRLAVGLALQPPYNFNYGITMGPDDPTETLETTSGGKRYLGKPWQRGAELTLDGLAKSDVDEFTNQIDIGQGVRGDVLFVPFPAAPSNFHRDNIWGSIKPEPSSWESFGRWNRRIRIDERPLG